MKVSVQVHCCSELVVMHIYIYCCVLIAGHCHLLLLFTISPAVDRMESLPGPLVQEWYEMRAGEIEARSRLVDNALELIKLAIQRGFDVSLHDIVCPCIVDFCVVWTSIALDLHQSWLSSVNPS